jgi:hypothetical protein
VSAHHRPDPGVLAEYAEGLLDGTPEGEAVAARLGADPAWAAAYAELTAALSAVRADLAALGPAGPVPSDVAARIDGALATREKNSTSPARPVRAHRRAFAFAGVAAAASVAVVVGMSVVTALGGSGSDGSPVSAAPPDRIGQTVITSTGTDYGTVSGAGTLRSSTAGDPGTSHASGASDAPMVAADAGPAPTPVTAPVPAAFGRLTAPAALAACLEAVRRLVGAGAPATRSADFGRFSGLPALVILLAADPSGNAQMLAVGPSCGDRGVDLISRAGATP